jgi:hypothetical protein
MEAVPSEIRRERAQGDTHMKITQIPLSGTLVDVYVEGVASLTELCSETIVDGTVVAPTGERTDRWFFVDYTPETNHVELRECEWDGDDFVLVES